jgi:hypothetical protein
VTADTTAETAVSAGSPFADLIALSRPDTELFNAVVCDGKADFASLANVLALLVTLVTAVWRESRPFLATSTSPRLLTEVLRLVAAAQ